MNLCLNFFNLSHETVPLKEDVVKNRHDNVLDKDRQELQKNARGPTKICQGSSKDTKAE